MIHAVETRHAVKAGNSHPVIPEYADDNDIDLIGSVTEKVVRVADPPVVTVRTDRDE